MSWKKIVAVLAVLGIAGGFLWWWNVEGQYKGIQFVSGDPDVSSAKEYERYYEALKRAYAEDQYGGATPEETLQLFIDALKAGDVDLASKYFVVEKQGYVKENLPRSFESGAAKEIIEFYENGIIKKSGKDVVKFEILPVKGEIGYIFRLILNMQTGKWKMSEL